MALATPTRRMPTAAALGTSLSELLGREATVSETDLDLKTGTLHSAMLLDDEDGIAGAIIADNDFACRSGGSLVMLPQATVTSAIDAGTLEDSLRDNYYEVANILSALLNGPAVVHVRINELVDGVPSETLDLLMRATGRIAFDVELAGYGSGKLAFYAT